MVKDQDTVLLQKAKPFFLESRQMKSRDRYDFCVSIK